MREKKKNIAITSQEVHISIGNLDKNGLEKILQKIQSTFLAKFHSTFFTNGKYSTFFIFNNKITYCILFL